MRMSNIPKLVLAAGILAGGAVLVAPSPANAALGQCSRQRDVTWAKAYCEGSPPSTFYISIRCRMVNNNEYGLSGPSRWAGGGLASYAACNTGDALVRSTVWTNA